MALHPGPVASVYLEVSRDRGGAPHEVQLRWEALAAQLCEQGADDKTVDAQPDLTDGLGALLRFTSH